MNLQEAVERFDEIEEVEDSLLQVECEDCGEVLDVSDMDEYEVPEECDCGGEFIPSTCHEGMECAICNHTFDMWEDAYSVGDELICNSCYVEVEAEHDNQ